VWYDAEGYGHDLYSVWSVHYWNLTCIVLFYDIYQLLWILQNIGSVLSLSSAYKTSYLKGRAHIKATLQPMPRSTEKNISQLVPWPRFEQYTSQVHSSNASNYTSSSDILEGEGCRSAKIPRLWNLTHIRQLNSKQPALAIHYMTHCLVPGN
jgi:hypothetical protein